MCQIPPCQVHGTRVFVTVVLNQEDCVCFAGHAGVRALSWVISTNMPVDHVAMGLPVHALPAAVLFQDAVSCSELHRLWPSSQENRKVV